MRVDNIDFYSADKLSSIIEQRFGQKVELSTLDNDTLQMFKESVQTSMQKFEAAMKFNTGAHNPKYLSDKLLLDAIIKEQESRVKRVQGDKIEIEDPEKPGQVLVFVAGEWWLLTFPESSIDRNDPIASLDVALLQDRVLAPILGIGDPRTDSRIAFVGGVRCCEELEKRAGDKGVAFSMHATSADELLAVAAADEIMPPKSTWFEPKLRSGLFVHEFERIDGAKA